MSLNKRKTYTILFILLLFVLFVNLMTFKNGHDWGGDFSAYIGQAKSLADGTIDEFVSRDKFLIENSTRETGTSLGPWGYPFILFPVYLFFGLNIYAMKVCTYLFFLVSLYLIFLLFQDSLRTLQNLLLVSTIALSPWFFDFKDQVLSDIPFFVFSLLSLILIKRFIITRKMWTNKLASYSLIGVILFFSYSIRSAGLLLLPVLLITQYIESRSSPTDKPSFILDKFNYVPYVVFFVLTIAINNILPGGADSAYFAVFLQKRISSIIPDIIYLTLLPSKFFPFLFLKFNSYGFNYNKFSLIIYSLILLVVIFGMIKTIKKDYIYFLYILFTILVLIFVSQRQGFRLIIPIFPFFLYFLFIGLSRLTISFSVSDKYNPLNIRADILFGIGMVLISLLYIAQASYQNIAFNKTGQVIEGPYTTDSIELFRYIEKNTDKNASVIFKKPRVLSLYADRNSFILNEFTFKFNQLMNSAADYIAYDKVEDRFSLDLQNLREKFNCPFENKTYILCQLKNVPNALGHPD